MSALLYAEPLVSCLFLSQRLVCQRNQEVIGVRLHLARVGAPTGNLFVSVYDESDVLLKTSPNVDLTDLGEAGEDWFGFVPFDLGLICAADSEYKFALGFSSYTFAEANHVAWLREWGFGANKYRDTVSTTVMAPLDLEVWDNKLITKGTYP